MSRWLLFLGSIVLAVLAVTTRWTIPIGTDPLKFVMASAALGLPWYVLLVVSVRRYGARGLWVALGAPLVLFWPVMLVLAWYGCEHGADCP